MDSLETSWEELRQRANMGRPHMVILGAGASLAAFPEGDRFGRVLPLMNNLTKVLDLDGPLADFGFESGQNFEDVYSVIATDPALADLKHLVEDRVSAYFADLRLPDTPTIYDYLVLSLRKKDYIATFNWDPFLYYACWRNEKTAPLPTTLYLHGCAVVGCCIDHRAMGLIGQPCGTCGEPFEATQLLYPVSQKDYVTDGFIHAQWQSAQFAMEHAWILTIFGYSAPASDTAAIDLLSTAWGTPERRNLEEIEIIDIRPEDELAKSWSRFIHTHHYRTTNNYFESLLGAFPRRTCEAMWEQLMEARFLEYKQVPRFETLSELQMFMADIAAHEPSGA